MIDIINTSPTTNPIQTQMRPPPYTENSQPESLPPIYNNNNPSLNNRYLIPKNIIITNNSTALVHEDVVMPNKIGKYVLKETIGEGAFSIVKIAVDEYSDQKYACKVVPKKRLLNGKMEQRFEGEIRILQQMRHPGIASLYDLLKDSLNYYIILELCPHGSLFEYIFSKRKVPEDEAKYIFKQIIMTLQYIHSSGVAHRDIKPENILIDDKLLIKFIDFGFSSYYDKDNLMRTKCGSPCYASPECISGTPYDGLKSDIWSVGVMLYTTLIGQLPWTKQNHKQLMRQIEQAEFFVPVTLSVEARSLIYGLMEKDIEKRLTLDEIIDHPWLRDTPEAFCPSNVIKLQNHTSMPIEEVNKFFAIPASSTPTSTPTSAIHSLSNCQALHYSCTDPLLMEGKSLLARANRRPARRMALVAKRGTPLSHLSFFSK